MEHVGVAGVMVVLSSGLLETAGVVVHPGGLWYRVHLRVEAPCVQGETRGRRTLRGGWRRVDGWRGGRCVGAVGTACAPAALIA